MVRKVGVSEGAGGREGPGRDVGAGKCQGYMAGPIFTKCSQSNQLGVLVRKLLGVPII